MVSSTKKLRGLGRGLDALLGADSAMLNQSVYPSKINNIDKNPEATAASGILATLSVSQLQSGVYQPRTHMDEGALQTLAHSIKTQGLMQPILVRCIDTQAQRYEIIAGERRWRASQLAGLTEIPVLIKEVANEHAAVMALIENIQRENLNPLEEAQGIERLVKEFGLTHDQAANAVGRSRSAVSNLLRLLQLSPVVQTMLMASDLDMGHARTLVPLDPASQIQIANIIIQKQLSVRECEKLVAKTLADNNAIKIPLNLNELNTPHNNNINTNMSNTHIDKDNSASEGDIQSLAERVSDALGAAVTLEVTKTGQGKLVVHFQGLEVLQGLIERLGVQED